MLPQLVAHVLDFCYPGSCSHCAAACPGSAFLCNECSAKLKAFAQAPACLRCAMPLPQHDAPCPYCLNRGIRPFTQILRLGIFHDPLKDLIHHMKYHRRWTLAEQLAGVLAEQPRVRQLITEDSVLVPVPLHFLRHFFRGYNQADVIARRLRKSLKCQISTCATRTRDTAAQAQIHAHADREQNVRGAFALKRPRAVANKHVVLVDDVMTTGSTLRSLARALLAAKPASISAIVLAVADPKHHDFEVI